MCVCVCVCVCVCECVVRERSGVMRRERKVVIIIPTNVVADETEAS